MSAGTPSTIRSILVHLDGTPACAARLALARRQARLMRATLWAMFVAAAPERPLSLAISESPSALLEMEDWAALGRARALFEDVGGEGGVAMRWLDVLGQDAATAFLRDALCVDLLVLGQPDVHAPAGFLESALVETGRPALVVPREATRETIGSVVAIGWNATPSAARAVSAAMPWLRGARHVHVLQAVRDEDAEAPGLDIATYLRAHGIEVEVHPNAHPGDAGQALLALGSRVSADLLVMGAFGRGRTREHLLGGTTRTMLEAMTLPVLMVH